jgi:uncharacterized protein (TIGR04168 family)
MSVAAATAGAAPLLGPAREGVSTIAVVGDVHGLWDPDSEAALLALRADVAVFLGDFGEEDVDLVSALAAVSHPCKLFILGNHDAWYSLTSRGRQRARRVATTSSNLAAARTAAAPPGQLVDRQLDILGINHVGFSSKRFPALGLTFVGGRPFSKGGGRWDDVASFYRSLYGVESMEDSSTRILEAALDCHPTDSLILLAHNGPAGLGNRRWAPCGVDWLDTQGDHGDPDLRTALAAAAAQGHPAAVVLFGHMHHLLKGGGKRDMVHVDGATGTVYLNAAVVPRIRKLSDDEVEAAVAAGIGGSRRRESDIGGVGGGGGGGDIEAKAHHFLVVEVGRDGAESARHVWVGIAPSASSSAGAGGDTAGCERRRAWLVKEEQVLVTAPSADDRSTVCSFYKAHTGEWDSVVRRRGAGARQEAGVAATARGAY